MTLTLTPATLRLDLKCGKGAISKGEKCTKGPAQRVNPGAKGPAQRVNTTSKGLEKMPTKALKSHYYQLFDSLIKKYPGKVNNENDSKKFRAWAAKQPENAEANAVQAILTRRRQRGQRITAGAAGVAAAGGLLLAGALTGRLRRDAKTDIWATGFDAEDGKKYTKVVTNPETGRKNRIRYGAKGYKIAPGTPRGNNYCARSFGDMKSHGKNCAGADRNTPLCLSRAKWRCSGKVSRRDGALTPGLLRLSHS
jgi:hypothetical protein